MWGRGLHLPRRLLTLIILSSVSFSAAACSDPIPAESDKVLDSGTSRFSHLSAIGDWLYYTRTGDDSESEAALYRRSSRGEVTAVSPPQIPCDFVSFVRAIFKLPAHEVGIVMQCKTPDDREYLIVAYAGNPETGEWRLLGNVTRDNPPAGPPTNAADACWDSRTYSSMDLNATADSICLIDGKGRYPQKVNDQDLYYVGSCGGEEKSSTKSTICRRREGVGDVAIDENFSTITGMTSVRDELVVTGTVDGMTGLFRVRPVVEGAKPTLVKSGDFAGPTLGADVRKVFILRRSSNKKPFTAIDAIQL